MQNETVEEIQNITGQLAKLLVTIEPKTPAEWEAFEKMSAAHKQLRSIEADELIERPPRAANTR